jgi:hypothetical protein
MILHTIIDGFREARKKEAERLRAERIQDIEAIVKSEVAAYLAKLPEADRLKVAATAMQSTDLTDGLLRRFVASCPADKHIEVKFSGGATVTISGAPQRRGGPGW